MQFKFFTIAAALTGLVAAQESELTPKTVVKSVKLVTDISADTNDILTDLNPFNLISVVPKAIGNIRDIAMAVQEDITMISNADVSDPFPKDGQNEICEGFRDFVRVHQMLLETIIGKTSFLSQTPFISVITAVLRVVEKGVDDLAFGIIDLVPTCEKGLKSDKKKLDTSFDETFEKLG